MTADILFDAEEIRDYAVTDDELLLFMQEIEIAVLSDSESMWGNGGGLNLRRYVYNRFVNTAHIRSEVEEHIRTNCPHANMFNFDIAASFITIEQSDVLYIKATVYTDGGNAVKSFAIR